MMCLLPDFSVHYVKAIFYPEVEHVIMVMQSLRGDVPPPLKTGVR